MFERYTEDARRAVFFARYEASQCGAKEIGSIHLLLGIIREGRRIFTDAGLQGSFEDLANACRNALPLQGEKTSTSVDMPLTNECKRALADAAEQAELQQRRQISPIHLVLGLMKVSTEISAILQNHGVTAEKLGAVPHSYSSASSQGNMPAVLEFVCQGERIATSPVNFINPLPRAGDEVTFTREGKTESYKVLSIRQCFEGPPLTKTLAHCWLVKVLVETERITPSSA